MRQIRLPNSQPPALPTPLPVANEEATGITVDLRDHQVRHPSYTDEARIRRQLASVRAAVATVMEQLSDLVDERENLKAELGLLAGSATKVGSPSAEDHSVVAWGFYDDDL